jgi:DNA end-binding protein Ku
MTARAMGSATISFGLVSIPVKLYSTSETRSGVSFNMLHGACGSRLKQQYICPKCEQVVPREDMVKGYEFAKDQYVTFTAEELEAIEAQATEAVDIAEFVPAKAVDPIYYDRAYYLGPDKGGAKAYALLAEALRKSERVALGRYAARGKQYLVMLRVSGRGLVLQQLRYADEVKPASEVPLDDTDVRDAELALALKLVEQVENDRFEPEKYEDDVRKAALAMIDKKVAGQEITVQPHEPPMAKVIDLMEALKASLAQGGAPPPAARPAAEAKAEPAARKGAKRADKAETKPAARKSSK